MALRRRSTRRKSSRRKSIKKLLGFKNNKNEGKKPIEFVKTNPVYTDAFLTGICKMNENVCQKWCSFDGKMYLIVDNVLLHFVYIPDKIRGYTKYNVKKTEITKLVCSKKDKQLQKIEKLKKVPELLKKHKIIFDSVKYGHITWCQAIKGDKKDSHFSYGLVFMTNKGELWMFKQRKKCEQKSSVESIECMRFNMDIPAIDENICPFQIQYTYSNLIINFINLEIIKHEYKVSIITKMICSNDTFMEKDEKHKVLHYTEKGKRYVIFAKYALEIPNTCQVISYGKMKSERERYYFQLSCKDTETSLNIRNTHPNKPELLNSGSLMNTKFTNAIIVYSNHPKHRPVYLITNHEPINYNFRIGSISTKTFERDEILNHSEEAYFRELRTEISRVRLVSRASLSIEYLPLSPDNEYIYEDNIVLTKNDKVVSIVTSIDGKLMKSSQSIKSRLRNLDKKLN